jgi:4-amino-4-deoxy-L-arabinose transferase-like glycosyltransferase
MADTLRVASLPTYGKEQPSIRLYSAVVLLASAIYIACIISPPSLMDDVDAVHGQIARNMLSSGDWVTAHLDGVPYMEKAPLPYWLIGISFKIFGVHDWAARLPVAFAAFALAWLTAAFGRWAFGERAGLWAGVVIATCVGLFLFTRIQIPDVMQTFTVELALWAFLRVMDENEPRPKLWSFLLAASLGTGLLIKSLIGVVFPVGAAILYLLLKRRLFDRWVWRRLHPFTSAVIVIAIAAPWHVLATIRNPPYFDFTMHSERGQYHGFFWFFFINEQLLRFLNRRFPHDYNTVPRLYFWLFHLLWLFPWSVYLPAVAKLEYRAQNRASQTRLLALCWIGVVLGFFTFSTTQEYYSMPCYPAFALLLGSAMASGGKWIENGTRVLGAVAGLCAAAAFGIWFAVRNLPTPGDISVALSRNPSAYTLSLGHMEDLTLPAFAYLRVPLLLAALAFLIGALGCFLWKRRKSFLLTALMMVVFFQAARLALVVFDPYLSSRILADKLLQSPPGKLIVDHHYYIFSSVFFYTNRTALLVNGRVDNLIYGSYAPTAPDIFIDDTQWKDLWTGGERCYLVAERSALPRLQKLVPQNELDVIASSGDNVLLTNRPL